MVGRIYFGSVHRGGEMTVTVGAAWLEQWKS